MTTTLIIISLILIFTVLLIGIRAFKRRRKENGKDKIYPLW